MKTGIELIIEERNEQLTKHGYDLDHDIKHYPESKALITAALFALSLDGQHSQKGWEWFENKMWDKSMIERFKIAGALIAAEIDRLQAVGKNNE